MDVSGGSTANQTKVQYYSDNNSIAQKWTWFPNTKEIKGLSNKCLDSGSGNSLDYLRINDCTGNGNQKFSINRDYGIVQNGLCVGTSSGSTSSGNILILKPCTYNDCSSYLEYQDNDASGSYSPSLVNAQGCGSFTAYNGNYGGSNTGSTGGTGTSTTTNPQTPSTPTTYVPPQPTTGGNPTTTYVPPGGTGTGSTGVLTPEEQEPIDQGAFDETLNSNAELDISYESSGLDSSINALLLNINSRYQNLTSDVVNCQNLLKCGTAYGGALWNLITIITRFLCGVLKGVGAIAFDTVFDILTIGTIKAVADEIYYSPNPSAILYRFSDLFAKDGIKGTIVLAGEYYKYGALSLVNSFLYADWGSVFENLGYWIAYVGVSSYLIYLAVVDFGATRAKRHISTKCVLGI
jgi:Ricin-type beta-trefoil lectin domain